MLFGLAGAHRTGKSTLAKRIAEDLGIHYYATSTTEVAKSLGFDPVAPMTLGERAELQSGLLSRHLEDLTKLPRPLITDRTPADILGYMLCEIHMQSHLELTPSELDGVEELKTLALTALKTSYHHVYTVGALPTYAQEPGKPPFNRPYQSHHSLLVDAIVSASGVNYSMIRTTDLETRVQLMHDHVVKSLDEIDAKKRQPHYN